MKKQQREHIAREIVERLFQVAGLGSNGRLESIQGDRLAVMQGLHRPTEVHLGGWARSAAKREILEVLDKHKSLSFSSIQAKVTKCR